MRLPLLVCGTPKYITQTPIILLPLGKWKIVFENHQDTITHPLMGAVIEAIRPQAFAINIIEAGSETNLNIYAELIE